MELSVYIWRYWWYSCDFKMEEIPIGFILFYSPYDYSQACSFCSDFNLDVLEIFIHGFCCFFHSPNSMRVGLFASSQIFMLRSLLFFEGLQVSKTFVVCPCYCFYINTYQRNSQCIWKIIETTVDYCCWKSKLAYFFSTYLHFIDILI